MRALAPIALLLVGGLAACARPRVQAPRISPSLSQAVIVRPLTYEEAHPEPTTFTTLFVADETCSGLERFRSPSAFASPQDAVREVVRSSKLRRLPLEQPDVHVENRAARVDLQLVPGSKRTLQALTTCEQIALLGAISQTLKSNPRWGIERVLFTERGSLFAL